MDSSGFCGKPDKGRQGPNSGRTLLGKVLEHEGLGPHAKKIWPTPKASPSGPDYARMQREGSGGDDLATAVARYPTPAARDYRSPNKKSYRDRGGGSKGEQLPNAVGGQLNPDWVEWLMGWPIGWTSTEPLDKEVFNQWLNNAAPWEQEPPEIPRVAKGMKHRVARLRALGNGQVPQGMAAAWLILAGG